MCRELHMQIELRRLLCGPTSPCSSQATDEWDPSQSRIEPSQRLPPNKAIFRLFIDALPVPVLIGMDPIYGIVLQEQGKRENPEFHLCSTSTRNCFTRRTSRNEMGPSRMHTYAAMCRSSR